MVTVATDAVMRGTDDAMLAASYTAPDNAGIAAAQAAAEAIAADYAKTGEAADALTAYGPLTRTEAASDKAEVLAAVGTPMQTNDASVTAILEDTGTTLPATLAGLATEVNATANKGDLLTAISGAVLGTDACTLTIKDDNGDVVSDARVYVSSDAAGVTRTDIRVSDSLGQVVFDLTATETYYAWRFHNEVDFTNPQSFVAVAD